jgi:hypothetical protein
MRQWWMMIAYFTRAGFPVTTNMAVLLLSTSKLKLGAVRSMLDELKCSHIRVDCAAAPTSTAQPTTLDETETCLRQRFDAYRWKSDHVAVIGIESGMNGPEEICLIGVADPRLLHTYGDDCVEIHSCQMRHVYPPVLLSEYLITADPRVTTFGEFMSTHPSYRHGSVDPVNWMASDINAFGMDRTTQIRLGLHSHEKLLDLLEPVANAGSCL